MSKIDTYVGRAMSYLEGEGVIRDYEQAYYWLNAAYELGSEEAAELLSNMRMKSLGVPYDGKDADVFGSGLEDVFWCDEKPEFQTACRAGTGRCDVNSNRCIACGAEALEPNIAYVGAKYCNPDKGGCGTIEMIPIMEQGLAGGLALQPYRENRGKSYSSLGWLVHTVKYDTRADDAMKAELVSEIANRIIQSGVIERLTGCESSSELLIVPVPSSKKRTIQPVEFLARLLADNNGKFRNVLTKKSSTESKNRPQGSELVPGDVRCIESVQGASILLIDDTYGEGATLRACIRALKEKGAREIYFLSACKNFYGGMKGGSIDDNDIY